MTSPSISSTPKADSIILQGLNGQQREAVVRTEGPLMILAGAGTGKTKVIAHRIAYLLACHPDLSPSNILALTFSRKAAQELLTRVEGLLGTHADELGVFTFHGFCHRFLSDAAASLSLPSRFQLLDRLESWIFFRKILPELEVAHHWSISNPTDCIHGFLRLISRAKDEFVGVEEYAGYVKRLEDKQVRGRLAEAARVYRVYQEKLRSAGLFDFGDLLVEALRALENRPQLLAVLRAQYRYVLVDEFQDTNVSQIKLLSLLAGGSGNLCVVGDDDQAIYRFRGASFASFLLLKEAFPCIEQIRLTQNYRSSQSILEAAGRLIRRNEDRYDPDKLLTTEQPAGRPVEAVFCQDEASEARFVVKRIQDLVQDPSKGASFRNIAVLYRAHSHRDHLVEELRRSGIPFWVGGGEALLEQPEIKDLVAFLSILQDPDDGVSFFRVLSHPVWGISPEDLCTLGRLAKERRVPWHRVVSLAGEAGLSDVSKESLGLFLQEWRKFSRLAVRLDVRDLVRRLVEESFLKTIFRLPPAQAQDPLLWLGRFLRFTDRYCASHPKERDLASFLWMLESAKLAGDVSVEADEEEIPADHVRLMTIHQAKGLEFDWVFLLEMVQGRFPARAKPEEIPFPVELMKERLPKGDHHLQEERRLCYVACTRAKKGLFLLTQERAYHRPSAFIREILDGAGAKMDVNRLEAAGEEPLQGARRNSSWVAERKGLGILQEIRALSARDEKGFSEALARLAEIAKAVRSSDSTPAAPASLTPPSVFSYTQLETYRYCPMKYLYSYLYQIPSKATAQMAFGVDIHASLESFFRQVMNGTIPSVAQLIDTFRRCHLPGRYGEPAQDKAYRRLGIELLSDFYKRNSHKWQAPLFVEKPFLIQMGDFSIRGVVDRVDPLPEEGVEVIDYKTGKPKESAGPQERLQLFLYALACERVFKLIPQKVSFYYVRTNEKLTFQVDRKEIEETVERVKGIVGEIRSGDFAASPSLMKCRRCDFRNLCPESLA